MRLDMQRFEWPDYIIFILMLLLCIAIGVYFGIKQKSGNESDMLMGGRSMLMLPIAMSLIARYIEIVTKLKGGHNEINLEFLLKVSFLESLCLACQPKSIYMESNICMLLVV